MTPSAPAHDRAAILVVGMHRSGTSAIARCINLLGAGIGEDLIPANWGNERGFWEDAGVIAANDALLAAVGRDWHDPRPMPAAWWERPAAREAARAVEAIAARESGRHRLWVVKDPRLSRLVPVWRAALARESTEPLFVIALRDPVEVALSQERRDGFPAGKSNLLWLRHLLEVEAATRGDRRVFLLYDDVLRDWRTAMARVARVLRVAWPVAPEAAAAAIEGFLSDSLRHFAAGRGGAADADRPAWVRDAWRALVVDAAAEGPGEAAAAALDRIAADMAPAEALLGAALDDASERLGAARAAVDSEHAGWAGALERVAALEAELAARRRESGLLAARLGELEGVVAAHRADRFFRLGEGLRGARRLVARERLGPDPDAVVAPAFRRMLDDSRLFGGDLRGFDLLPSEPVASDVPLCWRLRLDRPGLAAVSLAPIPGRALAAGRLELEVAGRGGAALRRAEVDAAGLDESRPLRATFAPLPDAPGEVVLRVRAWDLDAPLRFFEWRRPLAQRLGLAARAFCALDFEG